MNRNEDVGFLIHKIDNRIKTGIDNYFKVHDLTFSQSQVLHLLQKNGGSMGQKRLQTRMNVSHPTMVGLVQRLEANNFVTTEIDCQDRRNKIVIITQEALNFRNDMIRSRDKFNETMFRNISEEETDILKRLLNRMLDNISGSKGD